MTFNHVIPLVLSYKIIWWHCVQFYRALLCPRCPRKTTIKGAACPAVRVLQTPLGSIKICLNLTYLSIILTLNTCQLTLLLYGYMNFCAKKTFKTFNNFCLDWLLLQPSWLLKNTTVDFRPCVSHPTSINCYHRYAHREIKPGSRSFIIY